LSEDCPDRQPDQVKVERKTLVELSAKNREPLNWTCDILETPAGPSFKKMARRIGNKKQQQQRGGKKRKRQGKERKAAIHKSRPPQRAYRTVPTRHVFVKRKLG